MAQPDAERDPLEVLAAEFVQRQRSGQSPSISEYAAEASRIGGRDPRPFSGNRRHRTTKGAQGRGQRSACFPRRAETGTPRRFPHPRRNRPRGHGDRVRSLSGVAGPPRGRKSLAQAVASGSQALAAVSAGIADCRAPAPHQHRARVRRRRAGWISLHRHATYPRRGTGCDFCRDPTTRFRLDGGTRRV